MGKTLYQKLFDSHIVCEEPGELPILYVDRHLVHEVDRKSTRLNSSH